MANLLNGIAYKTLISLKGKQKYEKLSTFVVSSRVHHTNRFL
jgi:hypothetical protein